MTYTSHGNRSIFVLFLVHAGIFQVIFLDIFGNLLFYSNKFAIFISSPLSKSPLFALRSHTSVVRSGRSQSPAQRRTSDQSWMPDRARTLVRKMTLVRETTPDRDKVPMGQTLLASVPDCRVLEPYVPPTSRAASTRNPRTTSVSGGRNPKPLTRSDPSAIQNVRKVDTVSRTPRSGTPKSEGAGDSEKEMRRVLTRLQEQKLASLYQPKVPTLEFVLVRVVV